MTLEEMMDDLQLRFMDARDKDNGKIDHIAIVVTNINHAVRWYTDNRDCKVNYQDNSWAELQFDNIKLALVLPNEHPPHIGFRR